MCGIIYAYRQGADETTLRRAAAQALTKLAHRGPDDDGLWCKPPIVIGHRRLAILDLATSRQPMIDPSQRYVLTYNGEVYNYKELRNSLESVWAFRTRGDTEVVLAGLVLYGEGFLNRMEGMWALAFWDDKDRTLLLSRDRMGQKPLCYKAEQQGFACASELGALASLSPNRWEEDLDSTADYLRYGYYLPGTTAYKQVYEVLPGHLLTWRPGSKNGVEQRAFWSLASKRFTGSKQQAADILKDVLIRAVKRRLIADVEVGALLSGGVDSSLIVAIVSTIFQIPLKTFTIGFSEASYDERHYAEKVACFCGTDHYAHCFRDWDQERLTWLIVHHAGQPFADSSLLPTSLVSELASQQVKVVLSGDGGDELFSGYQRYQARAILRWYTRLPKFFRNNTEALIKAIPEPMSHHSRSLLKKAHLFRDIVNRQQDETPYIAPLLYAQKDFAQLAPDLVSRGHTPPGLPAETCPDSIEEMMRADTLIYLPQDILTKVDRASMASSLEARSPFLDSDVVELAFSLPRRWHRRGFRGKRMLHESCSALLPESVWFRRKQGFGVPIHQWFRHELGQALEELVGQSDAPVNADYVREMLRIHRAGQRDHGYRLWNIYIYLLWRHQRWQ